MVKKVKRKRRISLVAAMDHGRVVTSEQQTIIEQARHSFPCRRPMKSYVVRYILEQGLDAMDAETMAWG
ncbi:MAG: hypothetical protein M1600_15870 [Firmicutes bacterium]|nr:hypothetical protein [Bacillota bacterium]